MVEFRSWVLKNSLEMAKRRLEREQRDVSIVDIKTERESSYRRSKQLCHMGTQICGDRPVSSVSFSPSGDFVVSGTSGGDCAVWKIPDLSEERRLAGHRYGITCVEWYPLTESSLDLCSSDVSGEIRFWKGSDALEILTEPGRVSRIKFHPSGKYLGTANFDGAWRLWDVETKQNVLVQKGHAREVYCISWHCDGGLAMTGSLDGCGIVWDVRSKQPVFTLRGHVRGVLDIVGSSNGYEIYTGGQDSTVKVWNMRKLEHKTVFAHLGPVKKIQPSITESWILTTSQDKKARVWGIHEWKLLAEIAEYEITMGDMFEQKIVVSGPDMTLRLYDVSKVK